MCPDTICHHTAGLIKEIGPSSPELVKRIVVASNVVPLHPKLIYSTKIHLSLFQKT